MRIGIVADIHGEAAALITALERLETVDQIICVGDLVNDTYESQQVIERIQRDNIPCVLGDHDHEAPARHQWLVGNNSPIDSGETRFLAEGDGSGFMQNLPLTLRFEWDGVRVLMAHGTPWSNTEAVFARSGHLKHRRIVEAALADVIILGHTHQPMQVNLAQTVMINPGSVCSDHIGGSGTFGILSLPDFNFKVFDIASGSAIHFPIVNYQ